MVVVFSANSFKHLYQLRLDVMLHFKSRGYKLYAIAGDDEYKKKINEFGILTKTVKIEPNSKNILADLSLLNQYYSIFREIQPDIIYNSTIKANIFGSIVSRYLNIKTINNISGLGTAFLKSFILKIFIIFLYKISQKKVFKIYFQNNTDLILFKKLNIVNSSQSRLIPASGVNTCKLKRDNRLLPSNKIKYLFLGRLLKEKGINELLLAANSHLKNNIATFYIAGDYNKNNSSSIDFNNFIQKCDENKSIKYLGYIDNVKSLLGGVDCLILPSYREGLSNVILEALSMEIPVLASNVPGCKELIKDGYNGFLFEPRSASSIKIALNKFSNLEVEEIVTMGKRGRKFVEKNYSIDKLINLYELDLL